jgi:3-oxoadipate enol-lactonase
VRTRVGGLAVEIDGEAGKPCVLLVNSLASDHAMWAPQIAALSAHRRIVRYDARGHGESFAPPAPYDFAGLTGDIVSILDGLGVESADVMGLSLGGTTGIALALSHPERVRKLICCCARGVYPAPAMAAWDQRIAQVRAGGMDAVIGETLARWFTPAAPPALVDEARRMMRATSVEGYVGCVEALKTADFVKALPSLKVPALFIAGERDGAAPPEAMGEMAAAAGRPLRVVEGAAHIANMERAEAFNALALDFLQA